METTNAKQTLFIVWIIAAIIILLSLIFIRDSYAGANAYYDSLSEREQQVAIDMEQEYITSDMNPLRFKGDTEIKENEYIKSDIIIIKGTLVIRGEIEGNVLSLFGDVELQPSALVHGKVISVEGIVWTRDGAQVEGDIIETGSSSKARQEKYLKDQEERYKRNEEKQTTIERRESDRQDRVQRDREYRYSTDYNYGMDDEPVFFDYNRVDGLTLGVQFPESNWWSHRNHNYAVTGKLGYSFASKETQYKIGLEKWLFNDRLFSIGGEFHDITDTEDRWVIDDVENSAAAFFIKEDFRDYYKRSGYNVYFKQYISHSLCIKGAYVNDDFSDMENKTNWSLFGKNKKFRTNPGALPASLAAQSNIIPGMPFNDPVLNIKSLFGTIVFDSRDRDYANNRGWYIQAYAERSGYDEKSDMDFERYIIDVRRFQPIGWDENLNIRLRAGTSRGDLPPMYWFDLGGISSLRGYRFKEFTGDRMVLGNVEYRLKTGFTDWFLLEDFDIILFVDSGYAWFADENTPDRVNNFNKETESVNTDPKSTFERLTWKSMKTNVGVSLASHDDDFRIDFARKTDAGGDDFVVTFRLKQTF